MMAKVEKRKLTNKNPRLEINLTELFGSRVPDSVAFREGVGQAVIDAIRKRTKENIDRVGSRFKNYSKSYSKTTDFKVHGKSISNPNMRLTGDMLEFMNVIDSSRNTIVIGWGDREEQLKAHGHITGASPGPRVRRDFFGLPTEAYNKLKRGFTLPKDEPTPGEAELLSQLVTLQELFDG